MGRPIGSAKAGAKRLRDGLSDKEMFPHGHAGEQANILKGPGDSRARDPVGRHLGDIFAREQHRAARRPQAPVITLNIVVLPAPLGPITPTI